MRACALMIREMTGIKDGAARARVDRDATHSFEADSGSAKHLYSASGSCNFSGFFSLKRAWPAGVSKRTSMETDHYLLY